MGEDGSVEDTGHEVVIIFEWQDKWVVALAKATASEEGRKISTGVRGRNKDNSSKKSHLRFIYYKVQKGGRSSLI